MNTELFIGYAIAVALIWSFCKYFLIKNATYLSEERRHKWKSIRILNRSCYCSICEILLLSSTGQFCDCCGICSHVDCMKKADKILRCKERYTDNGKPILHLWVRGNLPLNSICKLCRENIDYDAKPGLYGYRCCWCQRSFHDDCFGDYKRVDDCCDFGIYKEMIIPPSSFILGRHRRRMTLCLSSIEPPNIENWKPLIVIANVKSGSSTASDFISYMRGLLHPFQVFEIGSYSLKEALQIPLKIKSAQSRILVAGGDGTIGWVLNTIFELDINPFRNSYYTFWYW